MPSAIVSLPTIPTTTRIIMLYPPIIDITSLACLESSEFSLKVLHLPVLRSVFLELFSLLPLPFILVAFPFQCLGNLALDQLVDLFLVDDWLLSLLAGTLTW